MSTDKLFYADSYLKEFTARVEAVRDAGGGRWEVVLDRTAFYPEGGGQPCDTGWLDDIAVLAVRDEGGVTVHVTAAKPEKAEVTGRIDWARRFDHMQQHSGEHVLSGAFFELFGAENVGFHLGPEGVYIDVSLAALSAGQAAAAEAWANAAVYANHPVGAHNAASGDLAGLGLRKQPARSFERLRVVKIAGVDCCPCGGTHVKATGEIGMIKIKSWERKSGGTRVEFVCGRRALDDYGALNSLVRSLSARLSVPAAEVGTAVERQLAKGDDLQHELQAARRELGRYVAAELYAGAAEAGGYRLVSRVFGGEVPVELGEVAKQVLSLGPAVALLALAQPEQDKSQFVFACTPGAKANMNALLKGVLPAVRGKGGGSAHWAQGGGGWVADMESVLSRAGQDARSAL